MFVANDYLALMVKYAAVDMGLRVPAELSLVAVDNVDAAAEHDLTTFDIPKQQMGRRTAQLIIDLMEGKGVGTEIIDIVSPMVERSSVCDLTGKGK